MLDNKEIKVGAALSYISQAITILSGLIYTPIMLHIIGQSEYGLFQLSSSILSYLGLLNFGFSSGYLRFFYKYKVTGQEKRVDRLNGMYMIVFIILSILAVFCGTIVILNVDGIFSKTLTRAELNKTKVLLAIMVLTLAITFLSNVFDCYISAFKCFAFQRGLLVAKGVLNPFICIPVLFQGYGSIGIVIVSFVLTFASFICMFIFCKEKLQMRFEFKGFDKSLFLELLSFSFWIFISNVTDKINWSLDHILLGMICGSIMTAIYGVGAQINGFFNMISSYVASLYFPDINKMIANHCTNEEVNTYFIEKSKPFFLILFLVLIGFVFFGKWFINIWAGVNYKDSYYISIELMIGSFVPLVQVCGVEIQRARNLHKFRSITFFCVALSNVIISIPLIRLYGAIGAGFGTMITMVVSSVIMNLYYHNCMGLNMKKYWLSMLKLERYFIGPLIVGLIFIIVDNKSSIVAICFGVLFVITFAFSFWIKNKKAKLTKEES